MQCPTFAVESAYALFAAAATVSFSFAAVFLRFSSSWISFIVFLPAPGLLAFVHTGAAPAALAASASFAAADVPAPPRGPVCEVGRPHWSVVDVMVFGALLDTPTSSTLALVRRSFSAALRTEACFDSAS
jgi:hypothetical protein